MEKKNYSSVFSIIIAVCILLLILWKVGALDFVSGLVLRIASPVTGFGISHISGSKNLDLLKISKDLDFIKLQKDNQALRDQFAVSSPIPSSLLPAKIIGSPTFIPTITLPDFFILDKGERDGVRRGDGVVFGNNLVGQISDTNSFSSKVILSVNKSTSLTGKLPSGAVGVVKGVGEDLEIDNVLASESLDRDMVVLTKGSENLSGVGIPPDLIIGKIISVNHDPSALFQKAKIQSLVDFTKIDMVFIVVK
jgi:rod shape-determining protein MreC